MPSPQRRNRTGRGAHGAPSPIGLGLVCTLLAGCANTGLPRAFADALATSPEDIAARLHIDGDRVISAAAASGPGGIPQVVRSTIDGVAPGGEVVFAGREWGPYGACFRVEKRYVEGPEQTFRSALIADNGAVLERSHSVPIPKVPPAILAAALTLGRDVQRCEIVSDSSVEREWRATIVDGGGRTMVATIDLDGRLLDVHRIVHAVITTPRR